MGVGGEREGDGRRREKVCVGKERDVCVCERGGGRGGVIRHFSCLIRAVMDCRL